MVLIFRICGHGHEVWEPSVTGESFVLPPTWPICVCWVGAGWGVAATHCVQGIKECAWEWCFCSQVWAEEGGGIPGGVCSRSQETPWVCSVDRAKPFCLEGAKPGHPWPSQWLWQPWSGHRPAWKGAELWAGQLLMSWALPWAPREFLTEPPVSQSGFGEQCKCILELISSKEIQKITEWVQFCTYKVVIWENTKLV